MISRLCLLLLAASALAASAADPAELIRQGDAFDKQLKTAEALAAFLQAEAAAPNRADILYRVAREYGLSMDDTEKEAEKKQRAQEALAYAQRAVAADANNADAHLALAICYGRIAPYLDNKTKIQYSKYVKEQADLALKLNPGNDLTWHVLGVWNYELANLNGLLRVIASTLYGKLPEASNEEAVRHLQKALSLNSRRVANHVELGKIYLAMGKKDLAKAELQKGLNLPSAEKDDEQVKRTARELLKKL